MAIAPLSQAFAQSQVGPAASATTTPPTANTVDEIIVTAQKRTESLQNVPISLTSLNAKALQSANVKDIKDLQILVPGLNVNSSSNEVTTTARIHGVGTVGENPGIESSVGIVIDGVYRPRNGVGFNDLGEVERIEVLRGPQGTLFGKNTSAGVINVVSKKPAFVFHANGEVTLGNYGAAEAAGYVEGPLLGDKLAGSLFATGRKRDGFYDVDTSGGPRTDTEDGDRNYYSVRGQLLAKPITGLEVRVIADYTKRDENCCAGVQTITGATAPFVDLLAVGPGVAQPANPDARRSFVNRPTDQRIEDKGVSIQADWTPDFLPGVTLTSITAARRWRGANSTDLDFSGADILYRPSAIFFTRFSQFSQELRASGRTGRLTWLAGVFYADEDLHQETPTVIGAAYESYLGLLLSGGQNTRQVSALTGLPFGASFPTGSGQADRYDQNANSLAYFTNNTIRITDRLNATIGLRYTQEVKSLSSFYNNLPGTAGCAAALVSAPAATRGTLCLPWTDPGFANFNTLQKHKDLEWSGTGKLDYRVTSGILAYVSYARGYKAGGFNLDRARLGLGVPNPNTDIPAEFAESWEGGLKTTWLNRTLSINSSIFSQTFTGFQLNVFTGISNIVVSIPEVASRGIDNDVVWFTPIQGLTLQGGVTYAETQYGQFTPRPGVPAALPNTRLSFAPLWSSSLAANYERDIPHDLRLGLNFDIKYSSDYNTGSDLAAQKVQPGFALLNGRIAVGPRDRRWSVELWAQNLTDETYRQVVIGGTLQTGTFDAFLGAPRTFGATVRARY